MKIQRTILSLLVIAASATAFAGATAQQPAALQPAAAPQMPATETTSSVIEGKVSTDKHEAVDETAMTFTVL